MKKQIIAAGMIGLMGLLGVVLLSAQSADTKAADSSDGGHLRQRLSRLEERVKSLEARVNRLETREPLPLVIPGPRTNDLSPQWRLAPRPAPYLSPGPLPNPPAGPKIWGQVECNGWTFYCVPLEAK